MGHKTRQNTRRCQGDKNPFRWLRWELKGKRAFKKAKTYQNILNMNPIGSMYGIYTYI